MPIFSNIIGRKTDPDENSDIYARKRMDFESNSVVAKSPNFMDLSLSPTNTPDKIESVIVPTARVRMLTNGFDWLASRYDIEEVTVERVSEAKAYSNYIQK